MDDLFRPQVGFAAAHLMTQCGCHVSVPQQSCCGQPAYNSGDDAKARVLATNLIAQFEEFDYLVAPSGSCAAMIKIHYPKLLSDDSNWHERAQNNFKTAFYRSNIADNNSFEQWE